MRLHLFASALAFLMVPAFVLAAPFTPPPKPVPTATAAQQKVSDAQTAYNKANVALQAVVGTLHKTLEASQEYIDANKAYRDAQSKFELAKAAVQAKLQGNPDYAAAVEAKRKAEETKEALLKDETATMQQRMDAANAIMTLASVVTKLESEAQTADPGFADAKKVLLDANSKLEKLENDFTASIKQKPEWQAAKQAETTAAQDLAKARTDLVTAQQADLQAQQAYAQTYNAAYQAWLKSQPKGGYGR
jgi:chromosome segregation ATPase